MDTNEFIPQEFVAHVENGQIIPDTLVNLEEGALIVCRTHPKHIPPISQDGKVMLTGHIINDMEIEDDYQNYVRIFKEVYERQAS